MGRSVVTLPHFSVGIIFTSLAVGLERQLPQTSIQHTLCEEAKKIMGHFFLQLTTNSYLNVFSEMNSKLSFVLRIGSPGHRPTCSIDLRDSEESMNKGVVLQVSQDNGIHWITLAYHHPSLFLQVSTFSFSLPLSILL